MDYSSTDPNLIDTVEELDNKDIHRLLTQYHKTKDKTLRDKIVELTITLVKRISYGLARRSTDPVDDLIQVGSIGLIKAIDQFDPNAGAKFHTYATHLITGEIRHYLRDKTSMIRAPRELQELSFRISRLVQDLIHELGREPTDSEVAEVLQISQDKISEAYEVDRRRTLISLDQTLSFDGTSEQLLIDTLEDSSHQIKFSSEEEIVEEVDENLPITFTKLIKAKPDENQWKVYEKIVKQLKILEKQVQGTGEVLFLKITETQNLQR